MPTDTRTIYRYVVPIDDQWHDLELSGDVIHVDSRDDFKVVELWAMHGARSPEVRSFRVFGTGHPLPAGQLSHRGTVLAAGGALVWHLMERPAEVRA